MEDIREPNIRVVCFALTALSILLIAHVPIKGFAATITVGPNDCSASAVNSAISSAKDGDTVQLTCSGSVSWTALVSIPNTKGITLSGGGTNAPKSSASFPLTIVSAQSPAVRIIAGTNNSLSRITGFKFQNSGTAGDAGFLNVTGQGVGKNGLGAFRIDNNYLDQISGAVIVGVLSNGGPLYGVIDSNTMHNAWRASDQDYGPYGIQVWNDWHGADGCWGRDGWTNPFNFGDTNFVFIEDNLFENTSTSPNRYMRHYISAELGGRFVVRYNDFDVMAQSPGGNQTDLIEGHGYCLAYSNGVGTRGAEVYHNTFSGSQMGRLIMPRGGTWLIYDNIFNNLGSWTSPIWLMEYRAGDSGMYGQCSQTSPCSSVWYPHVTDSPSRYPLEQQVSGTYVWNNLFGGVSQSPVVDDRGFQTFYIQPGRDYFVSASKPAALSTYTPHAYPHPLTQTGATILYGDVSENGSVTAYDASLGAQYAVGLITLTASQLTKADVSGNGSVTSYDASLIAQYAVGLISQFPVQGG